MLNRENELGEIRFSENVITRIIEDAVDSCGDRIILMNYRGKYKSVIPGNDAVIINDSQDGLEIVIYVVMKFGSSIRKNTNAILDYVRENTLKVLGEKPKTIRIVVTGVKSRVIARRHIVITDR